MAGIADQFKGLPMSDLIGQPLLAAAKAQGKLSTHTQQFINDVGLSEPSSSGGAVSARSVDFGFKAPVTNSDGSTQLVDDKLSVPLLSILNVPNLSVKKATVDFTMEVKSSSVQTDSSSTNANVSTDVSYSAWYSPVSVEMKASVSSQSKSESTRKTDNSAKYDVHVEARDDGPPEGLMKVLDILNASIVPHGTSTTAAVSSS
tara:strand:- start:64 stop:672 length:609 start_codon:yes stop_codon:yes gene_type:complete